VAQGFEARTPGLELLEPAPLALRDGLEGQRETLLTVVAQDLRLDHHGLLATAAVQRERNFGSHFQARVADDANALDGEIVAPRGLRGIRVVEVQDAHPLVTR